MPPPRRHLKTEVRRSQSSLFSLDSPIFKDRIGAVERVSRLSVRQEERAAPHPPIPVPLRRLETGHLLQLFGIASPFDRDFCGGAIDLAEVVGRKFDCSRSNVLL
jgi:hypothetical protein